MEPKNPRRHSTRLLLPPTPSSHYRPAKNLISPVDRTKQMPSYIRPDCGHLGFLSRLWKEAGYWHCVINCFQGPRSREENASPVSTLLRQDDSNCLMQSATEACLKLWSSVYYRRDRDLLTGRTRDIAQVFHFPPQFSSRYVLPPSRSCELSLLFSFLSSCFISPPGRCSRNDARRSLIKASPRNWWISFCNESANNAVLTSGRWSNGLDNQMCFNCFRGAWLLPQPTLFHR